MSKNHSDALRQRWRDQAYRERQTEVIKAASELPRVLSKRKGKMSETTPRIAELERQLREKEEEIVTLSRALMDLENWIEYVLKEGVPPALPASFGQWRRPA